MLGKGESVQALLWEVVERTFTFVIRLVFGLLVCKEFNMTFWPCPSVMAQEADHKEHPEKNCPITPVHHRTAARKDPEMDRTLAPAEVFR